MFRIPSTDTVFVCGNGDICFADKAYAKQIIKAIKDRNKRRPDITYYFQSKRPRYFESLVNLFPSNVIILTTLETDRDEGYDKVSKAPVPSARYQQLYELDYPRKVVTIEPIMDFDLDTFIRWMDDLQPEYVWLGFNSRPKQVTLPEPTEGKVKLFIKMLQSAGIPVKGKDLRGISDETTWPLS
jgi:hypothetical protein